MDLADYKAFKPGDDVPIRDDLAVAITRFAPHVDHGGKSAKVVSVRRSVVLSVQDGIAIKVNAVPSEATNLQFLSEHTSLPVPKLFGFHRGEDACFGFLVMEFAAGEPGNVAWASMSHQQNQRLTHRLRTCFTELRALTAGYIGGLNSSPLLSDRLEEGQSGPFRNEHELNDALIESYWQWRSPNNYAPWLRQILTTGHKVVFSHGDFALRNLIVINGELSAIVDWEYAGFYPEYWDYVIAYDSCLWKQADFIDWRGCVQKFLKPCPIEEAALNVMFQCKLFHG